MKKRQLWIKVEDHRGDVEEPDVEVQSFTSHRKYLLEMKKRMQGEGHRSEKTWSVVRIYSDDQGSLFEQGELE